jgi:hypothetical protein
MHQLSMEGIEALAKEIEQMKKVSFPVFIKIPIKLFL